MGSKSNERMDSGDYSVVRCGPNPIVHTAIDAEGAASAEVTPDTSAEHCRCSAREKMAQAIGLIVIDILERKRHGGPSSYLECEYLLREYRASR